MVIRRDILIMFVAMSLIPLGDTAGKLLSNNYGISPFFVSWARFATGALVLLPFVYRDRQFFQLLMDKRIIARGLAITGGITSILYSFTSLPITTGFSILFIAPLISYFLSVIFLKEQITRLRTAFVIGGFIGVLMVAQPSATADPYLIFAVMAGVFYGSFLTMSRAFVHLGSAVQLTSSQMVIGTVVLLPLALVFWPEFSLEISGLVAVSGIASLLGNILLIIAYGMAPATRLAPFVYFQIVAATVLGLVVFGHWPNALACLGMVLIITCGVLSASPLANAVQKRDR